MSTPILATKLYIPPTRPELVSRPRLTERLNQGLHHTPGMTLISAPAGFGKTTLVSEWVAGCGRPAAWLSLDEGDNNLARFLAYLVAALQTIAPDIGEGVLGVLQSPRPPPARSVLTALLNEITAIPDNFVLVLDDYHVIDAKPVDSALTFTLDHLPVNMHLVIASRSDPSLPLSRLRAGGHMTEIREDDLRFTPDEVAAFLDKATGLDLSVEDVAALGARTEGWVAGLQLAALSMQGLRRSADITRFVNRFTGSNRYIHDYLTDEVLRQRPKGTEDFLLQTSILNRLCGPLCDAVRFGPAKSPDTATPEEENSQAILEALEAANLFLIPLDNERRWYRYHHLFADLLRQRLHQNPPPLSPPPMEETEAGILAELHRRASVWYEDNGLEIEAFHHAVAANDVEHAARLVEGKGMPLPFRGAVAPVLDWLGSLPTAVLDARPSLWAMYASVLLATGQTTCVEEKLQAAEAALQGVEPDDKSRDVIGRIAATRATLALSQHQAETIIAQSRRALECLHPNNLPFRTATTWKLGYAYQLQGDRAAARQAYTEAISISQASGNIVITLLASTGLGAVQEAENQLHLAAQTYRRVLQLAGDPPLLAAACEAHLGLARILYEWNDIDAAHQHGQQSVPLARQLENTDRCVACEVFLARLKLAQGDVAGAATILTEAAQSARQHDFAHQIPEVAAAQVLTLLRQGNLAAAAQLAEKHEHPISQARVHLAQGDPSAALAVLGPLRRQMEAKDWQDERLKVMVLQAVAHYARGERDKAMQLLGDALALAEPGGFIRIFLDEGLPMAELLTRVNASREGETPRGEGYIHKLLAAFGEQKDVYPLGSALRSIAVGQDGPSLLAPQPLTEPLSQRELEVLQLIAQGLSNREIGERLFLALSTVKGHNRIIYGKLQVQRRTEAVARARELGLL
ncbi:MAG: LuxR C-terminal-related transcriptional regulator [Anaerolineae bacterium]